MKVPAKKHLALTATLVSAVVGSAAYAAWDTRGYNGVTSFNPDTNPSRIIYLHNLRPAEQRPNSNGSYNATVLKNYTDAEAFAAKQRIRNASNSGGLLPIVHYKMGKTDVLSSYAIPTQPAVWSHVSKSQGVPCPGYTVPGDGRCPSTVSINVNLNCSYSKVTTTVSVGADSALSFPTPLGGSIGPSINGAFSKSWERGWQSCQGESSAHVCHPDQGVTWDSMTFATSELRSKYAWRRMQLNAGDKIEFTRKYHADDKHTCEHIWRGTYYEGWSGNGYCNRVETRPRWESYIRLPIPNSDATPSVIKTCRMIKQFS